MSISASTPSDPASAASERPQSAVAAQLAWWSLLAAVLLAPIATSNFGWLGFERSLTFDQFEIVKLSIVRIATLLSLSSWAVAVFVGGRPLRTWRGFAFVGAFVVWCAVSAATSIHPATALFGRYQRYEGLLTIVNYAVLMFLATQLVEGARQVRQLAQTAVVATAAVAGYALVQYAGLDPVNWGAHLYEGRVFSTYGNPLLLGGFLNLMLPLAVALALGEPKRALRAAYWAVAALAAAALLMTFARAAWIGAAASLVVLAYVIRRQRISFDRLVDGVALAVVAVALVATATVSLRSGQESTNVAERFASLLDFETGSGLTRTHIWRTALAATGDRPILGFGPDTFRLFSTTYQSEEFVASAEYLTIADNAHSYPLQLASTIGLPGALLFFGIVLWVVLTSAPALLRRSEGGDRVRLLLGAFAAGSTGYVIGLSVGLSHPGVTFLLWVLMGAVLAPAAPVRQLKPAEWHRPVAYAACAACALTVMAVFITLGADSAYRDARLLPTGTERMAAADRAVAYAPYYDTYRIYRGAAYAERAINALASAKRSNAPITDEMRASYELAARLLEEARAYSPWEQDAYLFLATTYNYGGRSIGKPEFDKSAAIARAGLERMPTLVSLRLQLARALAEAGRAEDAATELERIVDLDPRMGEASVELARILQARGDAAGARGVLERARGVAVNGGLVEEALRSVESSSPIAVTW